MSKGGSLAMWRKYFGDRAVIFGVDVDEKCRELNGTYGQVRIGSQDNHKFLLTVVEEMGGLDIVLDDGSHRMAHIRKSFDTLFPCLSTGGLYIVEDLHTAYWPYFGGGLRAKNNFYNYVRELIDSLHHWYLPGTKGIRRVPGLKSIHIFDSMVIFEKGDDARPRHSFIS